ncbi:MAG: 4-hydroxy-tetrahydrodipicolinate reductase [Saprospiraceae bacterium]
MKIAIIGYGKMGKIIEKIALSKGHEVILRITRENAANVKREDLKRADVAIEFSRPETAFQNVANCLEIGLPIISGTTGWLDQLSAAKKICLEQKGAFLYASNFSVGVNVFFALNKYLASLMSGHSQYNVSMEEVHHVEKLDYPSGTAITLAEGILSNTKEKKIWEGRLEQQENKNEPVEDDGSKLIITSKRIDSVPGTHIVKWSSSIEQIEISHVAHSREGFAEGAIAAAEWIIGKEGFFGMEDMLGF